MTALAINRDQLSQVTFTGPPADKTLTKIAKLYAAAFADPPWNEYTKCTLCPEYYGRITRVGDACENCSSPLTLAYPEDATVAYIREELSKSDGTLVLFEDEKEAYAAGWGFSCSIQDLLAKYKTAAMQQRCETALQNNVNGDTLFYISEVMVDSRARQQGIATRIATLLRDRADLLRMDKVMRTFYTSPMARIADNLAMVRIIQDNEDSEIAGRVLYYR